MNCWEVAPKSMKAMKSLKARKKGRALGKGVHAFIFEIMAGEQHEEGRLMFHLKWLASEIFFPSSSYCCPSLILNMFLVNLSPQVKKGQLKNIRLGMVCPLVWFPRNGKHMKAGLNLFFTVILFSARRFLVCRHFGWDGGSFRIAMKLIIGQSLVFPPGRFHITGGYLLGKCMQCSCLSNEWLRCHWRLWGS